MTDDPQMSIPIPEGTGPREGRVRGSALWAAYGDALGFISELTDERGLRRRTRGKELRAPMEWHRRIGGRMGPEVLLPAGCYSDDTQLRLAVGRCIGPEGFDVEAFAKVELPVWPSYALGGGRATKAAAANLARPGAPWFANEHAGWVKAGGNGAAMRIQPHVWASHQPGEPDTYVPSVVRDSLCTHGHPAALVGAVFHAACLASAMSMGSVLGPQELAAVVEVCEATPALLRSDAELNELWLGTWERSAGRSFADAWDEELEVLRKALAVLAGVGHGDYAAILNELGLFTEARRGSGTLTAVAALGLARSDVEPADMLAMGANALGSDTDTIATMTGALIGCAAGEPSAETIMDAALIRQEATRMVAVAEGRRPDRHPYPDLLHWTPPKTQADALVSLDGRLTVLGLGPVARRLGESITTPTAAEFQWQWVQLEIGQTLLIKSRSALPEIASHPGRSSRGPDVRSTSPGEMDRPPSPLPIRGSAQRSPRPFPGGNLNSRKAAERESRRGRVQSIEIGKVEAYLREHKFSEPALAYAMRRVAQDGNIEQFFALASIIREHFRTVLTHAEGHPD